MEIKDVMDKAKKMKLGANPVPPKVCGEVLEESEKNTRAYAIEPVSSDSEAI